MVSVYLEDPILLREDFGKGLRYKVDDTLAAVPFHYLRGQCVCQCHVHVQCWADINSQGSVSPPVCDFQDCESQFYKQ